MLQTKSEVLDTITTFIRDVIGEDWVEEIEITQDTSFNGELELESIEFVALAEKLQAHFGEDINFVEWLSGKDLEEIIALTVGDVAEFIAKCRS
ncbi:Acyl carrier protein [Sulfidibacter corallicola]|uniref:Acyl carrier protein n=1 Tax=Sulfidibacter corallicola TaxID=2818388 RepID=A0A8A4TDI6_SULCO|nr:phosphopantetheine-binding protein [Sulfidibacter corallicola]QTD47986.1 acyl carrier protein [Sulfidibacter corallicola]